MKLEPGFACDSRRAAVGGWWRANCPASQGLSALRRALAHCLLLLLTFVMGISWETVQSATHVSGIESSETSQRRCFRLRPGLCLPVSSFASSRRSKNVRRQDRLLLPLRSNLVIARRLGFFLSHSSTPLPLGEKLS